MNKFSFKFHGLSSQRLLNVSNNAASKGSVSSCQILSCPEVNTANTIRGIVVWL